MAGWVVRFVQCTWAAGARPGRARCLYLAHRQSRRLPFPLQIASGLLLLCLCMGFTWLRLNLHHIASRACHLHRPPIAPEPILWNPSPTACQPTQPITSYPLHSTVDLIACRPTTLINAIIGDYHSLGPVLGYPNLTRATAVDAHTSHTWHT
ncbi:hypothetical protein F4802DRAFT_547287 [Xylaria palmicola]|nr:hypothetical protein F4802DRAFT_547287 [Xylaria palmicola]